MGLPRLATDAELARVLDAALTALESVGLLVQDESLRAAMLASGCIEAPGGSVRIPRRRVEEMLAPRRANPEPRPTAPARPDAPARPTIGCQLAQFYLDPESGERVAGDRALLAELVRFGHVWNGSGGAGPVLLCRDVPPPVEPLEAVRTIARNTTQVSSAYPHSAGQVPYLAELGRVLRDDATSLIGACLFLVSPLRLDLRAGALLVELVRRGAPIWIGTQPAAGASAPVTVAGTATLAVAEILGGWTAVHCLDPELLPGAGVCSGTLDMRTADVSYSAPESMLQDLLTVELFRELCGGRCGVAGGPDYTDAKWPGSQKAFEAAFEALAIAGWVGSVPSAGNGLIESGKTFSPVQFMLDAETSAHLGRFARGVRFDEEDIALEQILRVGLGLEGTHLGSDHTFERFRGLFDPQLFDRSCWRGDVDESLGEALLRERAWAAFREVRARYEPASVEPERLAEVERIVRRGWLELCRTDRPTPPT